MGANPNVPFFMKELKQSDITTSTLTYSTSYLKPLVEAIGLRQDLNIPYDHYYNERFDVFDPEGPRNWSFRLNTRPNRGTPYTRPEIGGEWRVFVRVHGLRVGDWAEFAENHDLRSAAPIIVRVRA